MVLLGTGTPGTSREIYSEDANDETQGGSKHEWHTLEFSTRTAMHGTSCGSSAIISVCH